MRVTVDNATCQGHGRCNAVAPEVFPLNELGYCAVDAIEVSGDLERPAEAGAGACPERAITVER